MTKELTKEDYQRNVNIVYGKMLKMAKENEKKHSDLINVEIGTTKIEK